MTPKEQIDLIADVMGWSRFRFWLGLVDSDNDTVATHDR